MNDERADAELLASIRDDPDALEALYRRHVERVGSYATRRCDQPADVGDPSARYVPGGSRISLDLRRGTRRRAPVLILGIAGRIQLRQAPPANGANGRRSSRYELARRSTVDDFTRLEHAIHAARRGGELELAMQKLSYRHRGGMLLV